MALLHTLQENGRGYECFSSCGQLFFSVSSLFHALQESSRDHLFVSSVLHTLQETSRDHLNVNHLLHCRKVVVMICMSDLCYIPYRTVVAIICL